MEQNGDNCTFKGCSHSVHEGYKYCLQHLKHLTELNVEKIIPKIIIEELGVDANEVTKNARFIDDLGADSLDAVALSIEFGAAFKIDIPREDVEKIQGVRDAITYVTKRLLSEPEPIFILDSDINFEAIHQDVEQDPENVPRLLEQIVHSPLFQDYFSRLKLKTENMEQVFRLVVRDNWIDHVTTAPDFDKNKKLSGVHIIILGRKEIYYFSLKIKSIGVISLPLDELRLSYRIHYSERGDISEIEVSGGSRNNTDADETFTFKTQEGVEGALTFINKCLDNMEALK